MSGSVRTLAYVGTVVMGLGIFYVLTRFAGLSELLAAGIAFGTVVADLVAFRWLFSRVGSG